MTTGTLWLKNLTRIILLLSVLLSPELVFAQKDCDDGDDDECYGGCDDDDDGDEFNIPRVHAVDPNEIAGELGYDTAQWVSILDRLGYTIYYENDPDFATAPAQVVEIHLPVHTNLNIFTVQISGFGFGYFNFDVPEGTTFYQTRLDVRDSLGVFVDVTAGIDVVKNEVFWIFESIDPNTGLPPDDALLGFLPVNDTTVNIYNDSITQQGEGYVTFTIVPKLQVQTGDSITAKASIIFDINAPIETNTWVNLIDAVPPQSQIDTAIEMSSTFILNLSGEDDPGGVGIDFYDLYASKDSGAFLLIKEHIDTNFVEVTGIAGAQYAYYTLATDNVGNKELPKFMGDVTVEFPLEGWPGGHVVYVDHAATGLNNGITWDDAFNDLQDALNVMNQFNNVEEIWVAQGTYYPTTGIDRTRSFTLKRNAHVFCGFEGIETLREDRDPTLYPVFLSGEIGEQGDFTDNSLHVVEIDSSCADCLLDGATIAFGYATGIGTNESAGAGVLSFGTALLSDVQIQFCFALNTGAALFNTGPAAQLQMSGCLVSLNISILDDKDILNSNGANIEFINTNTIRP